ncbi:MAG: hypothetical protein MJE77_04705 [Proteobacteria bacterium]|nr:hypothetical protein [Pseudomonadota bacterium]
MKSPSRVVFAVVFVICCADVGCRYSGRIARPYPVPTVQRILADLAAVRDSARSFKIDSKMDYWVGDNRVKGTVLLMGRVGAYVRINALNPTGDSVAADLACNGAGFKYIDYNNDCQLTGPCSRDSIARLLRVSLEPDDFLLLAMGTIPVIANDRGALAWDDENGHEVITLTERGTGMSQTIALNGRHCEGEKEASTCRWEVVSSVVRDARGQELWNLRNKDFYTVRGEDGALFRVPKKTQFRQPGEKSDLLVRWREHVLNLNLDDAKFDMVIPAGLPSC